MDIKWKDGNGNILNANNERLIYLDVEDEEDVKTTLKKDEVKKITIIDGMMNIFKDFDNDLALTIVIPKKNKRDAAKIFDEYDKTGVMLKKVSSNFMLDLILESSMVLGNPLFGIAVAVFIMLILFNLIIYLFGDIGLILARVLIFGYPIYLAITYALLRLKRKRLKKI